MWSVIWGGISFLKYPLLIAVAGVCVFKVVAFILKVHFRIVKGRF